jgi:hypothetical protein
MVALLIPLATAHLHLRVRSHVPHLFTAVASPSPSFVTFQSFYASHLSGSLLCPLFCTRGSYFSCRYEILQKHVVTLPSHYRELFAERRSVTMYVSVTCKGQDIVVNMIRPRDNNCLDIDWLALPELLGMYGEGEFDIYRTSLQVTSCKLQTLKN